MTKRGDGEPDIADLPQMGDSWVWKSLWTAEFSEHGAGRLTGASVKVDNGFRLWEVALCTAMELPHKRTICATRRRLRSGAGQDAGECVCVVVVGT